MKEPLVRVFKLKDVSLPDPNPTMTIEEVQRFYCDEYPELTNATPKQPEYVDKTIVYEFSTNLGTKG